MAEKLEDIDRHTINLRKGDYQFLKEYCVNKDINASDVVRKAVSQVVDRIRHTQTAVASEVPRVEVEL